MSEGQPTPPDSRKPLPSPRSVIVKTAPDPFVGKLLHGRYRLNSRIARGGMGAVYLARDTQDGSVYAVKILRSDLVLEPKVRERFINEARAAKRINHPAVAKTFEVGQTFDKGIYIVMEHVAGPPLRRLLRQGPLPHTRVTLLAAAIAQGLEAAHRAGVVHRDLKPENVLIPRSRREPSLVKVVDFGIARIIDAPKITTTQHVIGTPQYISPEQAMGGPVDGRTDIYSLGVMMYEMLTGALPFIDDDPERLLRKHIKARPVPMSELASALPVKPALETLVMSCLSKSPFDRPAGMAEVISTLASIG